MLFLGETKVTNEITPSSRFTKEFAERQPLASDGRTLRTFNLRTRLFEYPCSYLIYSKAFDSLEPKLRAQVYRRLWTTLNRDQASDDFTHLTNKLRVAILEIIRDTKSDLPDYWAEFKRGEETAVAP